MSKDPAFLFYPNDYIGGTMGMTFEEKGAYIELLMMQFNRGHMGGHMIGQTIGQLWDTVKVKFIQDSKGLWYNERLEQEQNKRKLFTNSRKNNLLGINQYSHKGGHKTDHMEDENENVNKSNNIDIRSKQFYKKVYDYKDTNSETKNKFFEYWSEPNKSNTKMRFELEKTWDLNRRIKRWTNSSFNKSKKLGDSADENYKYS